MKENEISDEEEEGDASSGYFDSAALLSSELMQSGLGWEHSRPKRAKHMFSHPETGLQSNFSLALLARCNLSLQVTEGAKSLKTEKHLGYA